VTSPLRVGVRRPDGPEPDIELWLHVPSRLDLVGEAVELLTAQTEHERRTALSARQLRFHFRTALAEALANAMTYGNRLDPEKDVEVRIHVGIHQVRVEVSDAGDGFDPDSLADPTTPENLDREQGRGLFVIRHLADEVTFNAKGNQLCLVFRGQ
jgi:anti-sigma regulatory factor (Ser/Thr protein kinase)